MTITTRDQMVAAALQTVLLNRSGARTTVAAVPFGTFDLAGNPGAGTLAIGNTTAGVVPTNATAGYPVLNAFGGGNEGYLKLVDFGSTVPCRMALYDTVFAAGAFAFNQNAALTAPPSYSGRVPGGTDFTGCELWWETVTAFTGNPTISVGYTNQAGTTGRSTGAFAFGLAPTVGRMQRLPLQAGDSGIQAISGTIAASVATVGTFNLLVLRKLWSGRVWIANGGDRHGWDRTGGPKLFATSALRLVVANDSTAMGTNELELQIING